MQSRHGFAVAVNLILAAASHAKDYPVKPVPFTAVHFDDVFWAPRIETNRSVTVPFALAKCEETKRVLNFERAATVLRGEPLADKTPPGYPFDDSDLYKVIEGAAYTLSVHKDDKLEAYLDTLIAKIAAAQEKDGYLYTTRTIDPEHPHPWAGTKRWELEKVDSHELYNLGHLYEAAVAYYEATGKRSLLDVAIRTADLLDRTFGPGKASTWPGHQITELGLARLSRATGDERYLALAKFLLDARGPDGSRGAGRQYNQSQAKVVEQSEAVGHAVRATYMYSGMADVAALSGDESYVHAIDRIWDDVSGKKLYVTGGIGARGSGEAFGAAYELPNMSAYNETCAAIGNDLWNQRLFLLHADARYVDVMERTLYNGLLSGVSLDGKAFFYPNPLESNGQHERSPWFGVACCPGNITRFLASLPGYVYAERGDTLYVNLFVNGKAEVALDTGARLLVSQQTRYPWDGSVRLTLDAGKTATFGVNLRIPGWARNEAVPGDLYKFTDVSSEAPSIVVAGKSIPLVLDKGYVSIRREWKRGDAVELKLPMPVRRLVANEQVGADRGRVALQRGPLVYTAEWPDNPDGHVRNLVLADASALTADFQPSLLNGVAVVKGQATALVYDERGQLIRRQQPFTAIPYYAWANRGRGEMMVWLPRTEEAGRALPYPTIASRASVTTSGTRNTRPINDQAEPRSSSDQSEGFFHWWPRKGTTEWVEYAFESPQSVGTAQVYWYDDTGSGQVRVPQSWRLLYRDGDSWRPVEPAGEYAVGKDRYDSVAFKTVKTAGLRLEVTLQPEFSAGILEWKVGAAESPLLHPDSTEMNAKAPELFEVRLQTTKGDVVLEIHRDWAPLGADRFFNLVRNGYYDDARFHRVIAGKWAQFGINGDPEVARLWRSRTFPDEPRRVSNQRGTIAYAFAVPNGRTTQVFINLRDNSETHDVEPFVPFGRVVAGMDAVDALFSEYGETSGGGIRGGKQGPLFEGGNAFLAREFPRLDIIKKTSLRDATP